MTQPNPTRLPRPLPQQAQLPPGLALLGVEDVPVFKVDGSNNEKMSQLLESVECYIALEGVGQQGGGWVGIVGGGHEGANWMMERSPEI